MTAIRECRHCGKRTLVADCEQCGRPFALTTAHPAGRLREFDDGPLDALPAGWQPGVCDFCSAKAAGEALDKVVSFGMRQKTCPSCHTEFFSEPA